MCSQQVNKITKQVLTGTWPRTHLRLTNQVAVGCLTWRAVFSWIRKHDWNTKRGGLCSQFVVCFFLDIYFDILYRSNLLKEVQVNAQLHNQSTSSTFNLIFLGNNFAGKSSLVSRLKGESVHHRHNGNDSAFEYHFIDLREGDGEGKFVCLVLLCIDRYPCHFIRPFLI